MLVKILLFIIQKIKEIKAFKYADILNNGLRNNK